jgi:hypothetical protein
MYILDFNILSFSLRVTLVVYVLHVIYSVTNGL